MTVYRGDHVIGGSAAPAILDESSDERHVETAGLSTITGVQDVFAEELTERWPAAAGAMPAPATRVVDGTLLAWFGVESRPDLSLEPVEIAAGQVS